MRNILLASLLSCGLSVMASGFNIIGDIPGIPDGCVVELKSKDKVSQDINTQTVAKNGKFTLSGTVPSPALCEIFISPAQEDGMGNAISLMVENTDIRVSAAHLDSIPPSFYFGTDGFLKEKNVTVTGGRAQEEYANYKSELFPYMFASKAAHYNLYVDENRDTSPEGEKRLETAMDEAQKKEKAAIMDFVGRHPEYSISGKLMIENLRTPFTYTASELDNILAASSGMWDKARYDSLKKAVDDNRKYLRGADYTDFAVLDPEGKECRISGLMEDGKYLLVDFWASWCGPCRLAIPHVKELYNKYSDALTVSSVSLDSNEKAWRKAMEQENMEWAQLWADKDRVKGATEPYAVSSIPFMMVIDSQGKIVFGGHDPNNLTEFLEKTFGR